MTTRLTRWPVLAGLLAAAPLPLAAQLDYRNLDDDRPVRVEDAQSLEAYALELIVPYAIAQERGGGVVQALVPELAYGLAANLHVGVKAPLALEGGAAGLSGLRAFALYNFNTEFGWMPALALRTDVGLPVGRFAGSEPAVALKGVATRAFGAHRIHVNAAYRFGGDGTPALVESLPRWWAGVAVDRTLYRESLLVVADATVERSVEGAPLSTSVGGGVRWQWTPTAVLDAGVSRTLRGDDGHSFELTFAVTHVFGVRALVPGAR